MITPMSLLIVFIGAILNTLFLKAANFVWDDIFMVFYKEASEFVGRW